MTEQSKIVSVEAFPGARKEKIENLGQDKYRIYTKEPAQNNLANKRIAVILSEIYDVSMQKVKQLTGHRSRKKKFEIGF